MKYLIWLILLNVACGKSSNSVEYGTNPPEINDSTVRRFVDEFIEVAEQHGIHLNVNYISKIEFVDKINNNTALLGYCSGTARSQIIQLKKVTNIRILKVLVFHELGHCMLGESHSSDVHDIMYEFITEAPFVNWSDAVNDLISDRNDDYVKWVTK